MSVEKDLKILDDLTNTLDKTIVFVNNSFSTISDFQGQTQSVIQEEIDKICIKVSDKSTSKLNVIRNNVIKTLHDKYLSANAIIQKLKPIVEFKLTDLNSVINLLKKIIALYTQPYQQALQYTTEIISIAPTKIATLTEKINELNNIKNNIPIPENMNANFDKLKISIEPITLDDIISG